MVYFSQETQQKWAAGLEGPSNSEEEEDEEGVVDGGALWLPGDILLEMQMLPMVRLAQYRCSIILYTLAKMPFSACA